MTWTRLEPGFPEHPKILAAGPMAELLHVHGLIYCNRYLTDGFIPALAVPGLLRVPYRRPVKRLIELGIWMEVKDGYQVHDFLDFQMSKAEVTALKAERAVSGRLGGLAKARALAKQKAGETTTKSLANSLAVPFRTVPDLSGSLETKHVGRTAPRGATNGQLERIGDLLTEIPAGKVVH